MFDTKIPLLTAVFFVTLIIGISICTNGYAEQLNAGILLSNDKGTILFAQNRSKSFVPASILKILTSLCALHTFGENHRFSTAYILEKGTKNLFIKGFGDPLFISEVIEKLCRDIRLKTDQLHNIILDQTYFSTPVKIPGRRHTLNPYDAPNGALCANFNTIFFKWSEQEKRIISGEPQTPLLDMFHNDIKKTGLKQGRIVLSNQQSLLYPGFLIKTFLEKNKVTVTGNVLQGEFGGTIDHLKLNLTTISEGSGLSRKNLVSPDQMIKILIDFMPYYALLNRRDNEYYKTGTLSGVRTRAGYIMGRNKKLYPYVIMVNGKNKGYEGIRQNLLNRVFKASLPAG